MKQHNLLDNEPFDVGPDYWDTHDSADAFEQCEKIELEKAKLRLTCPKCQSTRIRNRLIDLPLLNGSLVFKRVATLYCSDCMLSVIPKETFDELLARVVNIGLSPNRETFEAKINEGLKSYEGKWAEKKKERRVLSFYFPSRTGSPAKAQMSVSPSEAIYPIVRSSTSETIRTMLGLHYYEDLEEAAKKDGQTISQYLKHWIAKKTQNMSDSFVNVKPSHTNFEQPAKQEPAKNECLPGKLIVLRPGKKTPSSYAVNDTYQAPQMAAATDDEQGATLLYSEDQSFVGQMSYDWEAGNLLLDVTRNALDSDSFDVEISFTNGESKLLGNVDLHRGQVVLVEGTTLREKDIKQVVLKKRQGACHYAD